MRWLAVIVLAGVLAVPASAAPPEGFRDSARLTPIASGLAGRPVFIRCAVSVEAWQAMLKPWDFPSTVDGLTFPDNAGSYFAPRTCRALEGWLRGKNAPTPAILGIYALSLVHETEHLRGVNTEAGAECAALKELPAVLTRWFKIKSVTIRKAVMKAAWANHRAKPAAYTSDC